MHQTDLNKVVFYSKTDSASGYNLQKAERILKSNPELNALDINEIFELYNVKKYIDNGMYLNSWTTTDIADFRNKVAEYGKAVSKLMAGVDDSNVVELYPRIEWNYIHSFWELVNDQSTFKRISKPVFREILENEPHVIHEILSHKRIVDRYDTELRLFFLDYKQSAEILLSIYEVEKDQSKKQKHLPKSLTISDKETIVSNYLASDEANYNYIKLIENVKNRTDFKISDRIRLNAKKLHQTETEKIFSTTSDNGMRFGVSVGFSENLDQIKVVNVDESSIINYSYSLDYIKEHNSPDALFENFITLFEYLDHQFRIALVAKKNRMNVMERVMGVHSEHTYRTGMEFQLSEMTAHAQIVGYSKILDELGTSIENVIHNVFTSSFQESYGFAENARFSIPPGISHFEKIRLLAPEFESVLKQYKLFVEEGSIDFELLQISSSPTSIKDTPSLNRDKYFYFNEENSEMAFCRDLFFSDQAMLTYVEPFKDKHYKYFYDLLINENVKFDNYQEYQKERLVYLIEKGLLSVDTSGIIKVTNVARVVILKDLYFNEVASFYRYPIQLRHEAKQMETEKIVVFGHTLFSIPEQAYFNYFLNKSEFTNGRDLRNKYLHGTQATPDEVQKHEYSYFSYLKLVVMAFLKIGDDLAIFRKEKGGSNSDQYT